MQLCLELMLSLRANGHELYNLILDSRLGD